MSKVKVKLTGQDSNIFNLVGIATKALRKAGQLEQAKELCDKAFEAGSYDEALNIIQQYVEVN